MYGRRHFRDECPRALAACPVLSRSDMPPAQSMIFPSPRPGPSRLPPGPTVRERARRDGVASLSDSELLALLLATGAAGQPVARVACDLLAQVGGVERLEQAGPYRLSELRGIGPVKATQLLAAR